jgi:subtilisin-like proprotein convertase family protein
MHSRRRRFYFITGLLLATLVGLGGWGWQKITCRREMARTTPSPAAVISSAPLADDAAKPADTRTLPAAAHTDSEKIWDFQQGGQPFSITLALDETILRDADGKESLTRLDPPATEETLPARLAALSAPGGVFPVAYLARQPRTVSNRRLVTPDLRVQLDAAAAEKVATTHHLVIKDRPSYAPGWVVMSAKNPFAALDAMVHLRALSSVASADVLLAVQHQLRSLPNDPLITQQWHLKKANTAVTGSDVNIETTWNYPAATGNRGAGVFIGIVDDGLQTDHPDLAANVDTAIDRDWNGTNGSLGYDDDPSPGVGNDHGTSCAGNAAARGNNGIGVSGTAPEATLVGMRLIADNVADDEEAEAMTYLPDVIQIKSNSWGPSDNGITLAAPGPLTRLALENATTQGRNGKGNIILWAGGNGKNFEDDSNYDGYANSIHTFAIGATDSLGRRSDNSEPGANLVVCAPSYGDSTLGITTVDRSGEDGYNTSLSVSGGDYTDDFIGTSAATPTAAGIVALMLGKNPNLGWRDVREILIRTAAKPPSSIGSIDWVDNTAGFHFNHDFGAGLIDATAAVNLATNWTNLSARTAVTSTQSGLSATIPDNNTTGISRTFDLAASRLRVEQVTLRLSATHDYRGDLEVTLTSPSGMVSKLAALHGDPNDDYTDWTFSSLRHWGELSTGTWTLRVADLRTGTNTTGGTLTAAELQIYGSPIPSGNPVPLARITQPTANQVLRYGNSVTVNVTASDLTSSNTPGSLTKVELFDNGVLLGTDTTAPYSFTFAPTVFGSHSLVAKATDSQAASGNSISVSITLENLPPVITAAALSATGQAYSDTPLTVASITASDPESQALTYSYQWQSSENKTLYINEVDATTATAPPLTGRLLRCIITTSDGVLTSPPFVTQAVNLLTRPTTFAQVGSTYSYRSGLVLRGEDFQPSRQAIIHEFSRGPAGLSSEWVEILTLQSGSLANWNLHDATSHFVTFQNATVWSNIPAGTLILIYNGASKDPLLSADDLNPSDGRMVLSSKNTTYFKTNSWLILEESGGSISLADSTSQDIHSLAYGDNTDTFLNVGSVGSAKSTHYAGDLDAGIDLAANWRTTTSLTISQPNLAGVTPAAANNPANLLFINALRSGNLSNAVLFRIGTGATLPAGLVLDPVTGILSGTLSASNPAGNYPIVIERYNTLGETVSQAYTLTLTTGPANTYASWIAGFPALGTLTGAADDPDKDGLPNAIENYLGTAPNTFSPGLTRVSSPSGNLVFRHTRTNTPAADFTAAYQWSSDLVTWNAAAATVSNTTVNLNVVTITDTAAPDRDLVEVTATTTGLPIRRLFIRLKASR